MKKEVKKKSRKVGTDVELFLADIGKVFRRPSVMRSAAADVARLDVDGCRCV